MFYLLKSAVPPSKLDGNETFVVSLNKSGSASIAHYIGDRLDSVYHQEPYQDLPGFLRDLVAKSWPASLKKLLTPEATLSPAEREEKKNALWRKLKDYEEALRDLCK